MSIFQSIKWAIIFEKQLGAFPNFSTAQLIKAKNLKTAHINRVNQEVYNRIDGKILAFSKEEKKEYWPKFLEFLNCLGWQADAFLFKQLFEIEMTMQEKENNKRRDMVLAGVENDIKNDENAEKLGSGLKGVKYFILTTLIVLGIIYWEVTLAILFVFFIFGLFFGMLAAVTPKAGPIFRLFLIWKYL